MLPRAAWAREELMKKEFEKFVNERESRRREEQSG
jgi:hypothetical protein